MDSTPASATDLDPLLHGTLADLVRVNLMIINQLAALRDDVNAIRHFLDREHDRKSANLAALGAGDYN